MNTVKYERIKNGPFFARADLIVYAAAAIFIAVIFILAYADKIWRREYDGYNVEIYINNENIPYAVYPLSAEGEYGIDGHVLLHIKDGKVWVTDSDCPDKLCEGMRVDNSRGQIICLPNQIVIIVQGALGEVIVG
jgi:hypothetical protein